MGYHLRCPLSYRFLATTLYRFCPASHSTVFGWRLSSLPIYIADGSFNQFIAASADTVQIQDRIESALVGIDQNTWVIASRVTIYA